MQPGNRVYSLVRALVEHGSQNVCEGGAWILSQVDAG